MAPDAFAFEDVNDLGPVADGLVAFGRGNGDRVGDEGECGEP